MCVSTGCIDNMTLAPSPRNLSDFTDNNTHTIQPSVSINYVVDKSTSTDKHQSPVPEPQSIDPSNHNNTTDVQYLIQRVTQLEVRMNQSEQHNKYITAENERLTIQLNKLDLLHRTTSTIMNMINTLASTLQKQQYELIEFDNKIKLLSPSGTNHIPSDEHTNHNIPSIINTPLYTNTLDSIATTIEPINTKYYYPHPSTIKELQHGSSCSSNINTTQPTAYYSQSYDILRDKLQHVGTSNTKYSNVSVKPTSNARNTNNTSMNVNNVLTSRPSVKLFPKYSSGEAMRNMLTDDGMGIG